MTFEKKTRVLQLLQSLEGKYNSMIGCDIYASDVELALYRIDHLITQHWGTNSQSVKKEIAILLAHVVSMARLIEVVEGDNKMSDSMVSTAQKICVEIEDW